MENKVKILVVEDEFIVAEEISEILKMKNYDVIGTSSNGEGALKLVEEDKPDIILLDIHIDGEIDGIQTAEKIREKHADIAIIYLTAFSDGEHLSRAKETNPAAYIVKPFDDRNLLIAIDLAFTNLQKPNTWNESEHKSFILEDRIYIKEKDRYIKLMIRDILFIKATGSYSEIITSDKKFTFSLNLKHLSNKFSHNLLCKVHRSYIINIDKIDIIQGNKVIIENHEIPVGDSFREEIAKKFKLI